MEIFTATVVNYFLSLSSYLIPFAWLALTSYPHLEFWKNESSSVMILFALIFTIFKMIIEIKNKIS